MSDKTKEYIIMLLYFAITIVGFGSMGIWLPYAFDMYDAGKISETTSHTLPSNIITYAIGIFIVALIDRGMHLFKRSSSYRNNTIEFLVLVIVFGLGACFTYFSLLHLKFKRYDLSISYASYLAYLSWLLWLHVKRHETRSNPNYSAIGGQI